MEDPIIQGACTFADPTQNNIDGRLVPLANAISGAIWDKRVLNVLFMDGSKKIQDTVKAHVKDWADASEGGIEFKYVTDVRQADIRVAFSFPLARPGQFFSSLGMGAREVNLTQATMSLGFTPNTVESEVKRLTLHEFGHALGLIHEHQSPKSGIRFKQPEVFHHFAQFGFTEQMTRDNILSRFSQSQLHNGTASDFDMKSVMLYPFPASIADPATPVNSELSAGDKKYIKKLYPGGGSVGSTMPLVGLPISVGGNPMPAFITPAQQLVFNFTIDRAGIYAIETHGPHAWEMSLYKATDADHPIKQTIGGGKGLNARIVHKLDPDSYYAIVRHMLPEGTGEFQISVNKSSRN